MDKILCATCWGSGINPYGKMDDPCPNCKGGIEKEKTEDHRDPDDIIEPPENLDKEIEW